MYSKQTRIAKFNFVRCLTNYSKSSAVHIADEETGTDLGSAGP